MGRARRQIQADWARSASRTSRCGNAIVNALLPKRNQKEITSLIEEFQYPKLGPGMMWERCREPGRGRAQGLMSSDA